MILILVLLLSLGLAGLGVNPGFFNSSAAWAEFCTSMLGFYCAGAIFLNSFFNRTVLPMGKPMGWVMIG